MRGHVLLTACGLLFAGHGARAAEPVDQPAWHASADGRKVVDSGTQQVWQRCVAGMSWNGKTCVGEPILMTRAEAVAWASGIAKADGQAWRLPRVAELKRLVSQTGGRAGPGAVLFPAAPVGWYWSVTASIDTAHVNQYDYANIARGRTNENANRLSARYGWAVQMTTGEARADVDKLSKLPVRLVRSPA